MSRTPPPPRHRLRDRATDTEEEIQRALAKAKDEVAYGEAEGNFDKVILNEVLEDAFDTMKKVRAGLARGANERRKERSDEAQRILRLLWSSLIFTGHELTL